MFDNLLQRIANMKRNHNKKFTKGRKIQMVPIFKRDKDGNKILDYKGNPIIKKHKKIYHV